MLYVIYSSVICIYVYIHIHFTSFIIYYNTTGHTQISSVHPFLVIYEKKNSEFRSFSFNLFFFSILMSISNKRDRGYPVPFSG